MNVPNDLGPLYTETRMDRLPVEPFNTASNLAFLLVILLLLRRLRRNGWRRHGVTLLALAIVAAGFVGGTLYHATRACDLWRLLDVTPIVLVVLLASVYFLYAVLGGLLRVLLVLMPAIWGFRWWAASADGADPAIAFGYIFLALLVIVPATLHCASRGWRHGRLLLLAAASFALAFFLPRSRRRYCLATAADGVALRLASGRCRRRLLRARLSHGGGVGGKRLRPDRTARGRIEPCGRRHSATSQCHLPMCLDYSIVMNNWYQGRQALRDPCQGNGTAT